MDLKAVTEALQATERLKIQLHAARDEVEDSVFQTCVDTLDNLRSIKSSLDGSEVRITSPDIIEDPLQELRQLTLMHMPESVTDTVREKFQALIKKSFKDTDVEVLFACLLTCPWYACTQRERGEQAKHNTLFIVYQCTTAQFVAPVNSHLVDQTNVIDKEWMHISELYHFVQFISKGRTRNVEALYCPSTAILFQTDNWKLLREQLDHKLVMGLRGFIEACRGQSVGGIGKKGKDGQFRMKDSTTFRELCDSFRLMHHAHNFVKKLPPCTQEFESCGDSNLYPDIARRAVDFLKSMYQNPDASKRDAFSILVEWHDQVNKEITSAFTNPEEVHRIVGDWHMKMRLRGKPPPLTRSLSCDLTELLALMEKIGGPVAKLQPEQILLITQAGSFMYGLSTPTSDVDYVVIYAEKTETYLTACKRLPESFENRGPQKQIEYGAYEVRCFAEMLHKGSVVILELVFKDEHNYMSPAWKALCQQKSAFISEKVIQQYLGLIKNNMRMIKNGKHKNAPQERKLFYQIYHKLDSVEYLIQNEVPPVKCSGPVRDFIMRVRTAPLEGDLSRDSLYKDCQCKVQKMLSTLAERQTRLPENCNFDLLIDWILTVRGLGHT